MIPIGLFGHVLFEQVGGVIARRGSLEADHLVLLAVAAAIALGAIFALRRGTSRDRRRRLAIVRSTLPVGRGLLALGAGIQLSVAAASLIAEGVHVEPARLAVAVAVAVVGILVGCLVFQAVRDDVLTIAAALVAPARDSGVAVLRHVAAATPGRLTTRAFRLDAGRAPPVSFA